MSVYKRQVSLLHEYVERSARQVPHKTALVSRGQRLTWREIDEQATKFGNALRARGVARGDRVILYLDNGPELPVAVFGVLKADAVFCVVNGQTKADKLSYIINDCRATAFVSDKYLKRVYSDVVAGAKSLRTVIVVEGQPEVLGQVTTESFDEVMRQESAENHRPAAISVDLASIIYTSGSTGDPKGVMLTHQNMVAAAESITTYLDNQTEDVVVNVLPMSFDYGLYQWLMVAQFGGTLVLESSFSYPAQVLAVIEEENVTGLPVVPTIASLLAQFAKEGTTLPGIRYVTNTAAALSPSHIEVLKQVCPNARVFSMYGLTECKRFCYLPPEDLDRKPGSVGIPMPNMEGFVVDPDTGEELPAGVAGELVIRGAQVMKGYWEKPEVTAEWLKPGKLPREMWLWTNDVFRRDEEGYLYFVGRTDDIIKSRGEKVSPREVEGVLYGLSGVVHAVIVGRPDPVLGEAIHAYLVLQDGVSFTPRDVLKHCGKFLEPFMVPKYVTFLSDMQKTTSGKISKKNMSTYAREYFLSGDPVPDGD